MQTDNSICIKVRNEIKKIWEQREVKRVHIVVIKSLFYVGTINKLVFRLF